MRLFACFAIVAVASALGGLLGHSLREGLDLKPASGECDPLGPSALLRGTLYLEKFQRLALYWENGDFELWDTKYGNRLGRVQRLPRPIGWCIASPAQETILTGDRMPSNLNAVDLDLWQNGFVPTVSVWDTKSGMRTHSIRVPEAQGHPYDTHEWYARWLNDTRVLIVRLLRVNRARASYRLRLIVIDTAVGKVVKASDEFERAGEHLFLSPDRKMALVADDNYVRRKKNGDDLEIRYRNIYSRTRVFDLQRLTVLSSWREPPDSRDEGEGVALIARWCPDGKTVLTVDDKPSPRIRLWDAQSGRLLRTFSGHKDHILDVVLTAVGDKILTASEDRTVRVWDARTGNLRAVLSGHAAGVNRILVLSGDKLAVSVAEEPVAKVWDFSAGKLKFDLPGHDSAVRDVEAVAAAVVRTVTRRGTVTTWDCSTGKQLQITPKLPDFPKRFGICELVKKEGTLYMHTKK